MSATFKLLSGYDALSAIYESATGRPLPSEKEIAEYITSHEPMLANPGSIESAMIAATGMTSRMGAAPDMTEIAITDLARLSDTTVEEILSRFSSESTIRWNDRSTATLFDASTDDDLDTLSSSGGVLSWSGSSRRKSNWWIRFHSVDPVKEWLES